MKDVLARVLLEGGPVLWGLLGLAVVLFGLFATTWAGLRRVRRRVAAGRWRSDRGAITNRLSWHQAAPGRREIFLFELVVASAWDSPEIAAAAPAEQIRVRR